MYRVLLLILLTAVTVQANDYVEARSEAGRLHNAFKYEEALSAFAQLAEGDYSDFQLSDALYHAAECARILRRYEEAAAFADRIPMESMAKSAGMQNLEAQRQYQAIIDQYGSEDLMSWPVFPRLWALVARGRAYYQIGQGEAAEQDLKPAAVLLRYDTAKPAADVYNLMALNRARNLDDPEGALQAWGHVIALARQGSQGSTHLTGCLQAADLLIELERYDEALEIVEILQPGQRTGVWNGYALLAKIKVLVAAGRMEEALAAWRLLEAAEGVHQTHVEQARTLLTDAGAELETAE